MWQAAQTADDGVLVILLGSLVVWCSLPGPWQASHCTPFKPGVAVASENPPLWKPVVWHDKHSVFCACPVVSSSPKALAWRVRAHNLCWSAWHIRQVSAPTYRAATAAGAALGDGGGAA